MFENKYLVPVKFVKPTEWSVLDYKMPSIQNVIRGNCENADDTNNIENALIVRNRKKCLSHFRVSVKDTIDEPINTGIFLKIQVTAGKIVDRCLKGKDFIMRKRLM